MKNAYVKIMMFALLSWVAKFSYADNQPKYLTNSMKYEKIRPQNDRLFLIREDDKLGFLDRQTDTVLFEPEFGYVENMKDDFVKVQTYGKQGIISPQGKLIVPLVCKEIEDFQDDLAKIIVDGKVGFVDKTGKIVVIPKYQDNFHKGFSEGVAIVEADDKIGQDGQLLGTILIDRHGNEIAKFDYHYRNFGDFSNGLAVLYNGSKYGFIDKKGKIAIDFLYDKANSFLEGKALVEQDSKKFWIDKKGKFIKNYQQDLE